MNAADQEFNKKVAYMERRDFDEKTGKFKVNEKLVIMCMSSWCPACIKTKPAFAAAADELKKQKIRAACIMFDGDDDEKELGQLVAKKHKIKGFPSFLLVDATGTVKGDPIVGGNSNPSQLLKTLRF